MSPTRVDHTDSISSQDPHNEPAKKTKSRRPPNTAFRQQRLKAWQPILTPKTVLPIFFIVGIIFAPIGGLLLWASSQVQEIALDYTECIKNSPEVEKVVAGKADTTQEMPTSRVSASFNMPMTTKPKWGHYSELHDWGTGKNSTQNVCVLVFTPPNDVKPPILFYYRLTNFYQNHRRYVKSFDTNQLKGDAVSGADIKSGECDPLSTAEDGRPYYPCGLIANSMFNDTYGELQVLNAANNPNAKNYTFSKDNIMWATEKDLYGETKYNPKDIVPPPFWADQYPADGYDSLNHSQLPNLHTNQAFQVWMRTAGLPTFSKLAQKNEHDVLNGTTSYRLTIADHFPVHLYGGTKSVLISTRTVMGGKNVFLGIAYVVVGGLCVLLGTIFTLTHLIKPRKLGDHTYLSWNNDQPSTATTTGRAHPNDGA
ncbi:CDC50 family protein-like protein [Massarina eburnea CBS 473.64]|uniref:CDC50 family protein-like protein n=1 Tax=Massarina eburnea CBS 473.64 TaxID=1395130 RepID=A0A6A6S2S3_9PLEO|nr:CDC50 family protein-like protein [Massarina eburnea CBS 473.64]